MSKSGDEAIWILTEPDCVEKAYQVPERDCARQGSGKLVGMAGPAACERIG